MRFNLHNADFLTAQRMRDAINRQFPGCATIIDGITLAFVLPFGADDRSSMLAQIEMIELTPAETPARVIVNSRTGTVVINRAVRLAPAAISHGKLVVRIEEDPRISQPAPFSQGQTAVEQSSTIDVEEQGDRVSLMRGGANLSEIVDALNMLGVGAADLVVILDALKQAGALQAEMVVI